ncbi:MAG: hypothetical protein AB1498_02285, partial [bacterium]
DIVKTMHTATAKFICIYGQPLSGKSTLMRRVGYDLASEFKMVLYVYKGNNRPEIWDNLIKFCEIVNEEIFLLIDDIFENDIAFSSMMHFLM